MQRNGQNHKTENLLGCEVIEKNVHYNARDHLHIDT